MKKSTLRTAAVGTFLGLALALGLGVGATVLGAAVTTPAVKQSKTCEKPEACPLEDKPDCPKDAAKTTETSAASHCPLKGSKI